MAARKGMFIQMKKKFIFIILSIILCTAFITGCIDIDETQQGVGSGAVTATSAAAGSGAGASTLVQQESGDAIGDYYPFVINALYEYASDTPDAGYDAYITYYWRTKMQRKITRASHNSTEVLENVRGELRLRYSEPDYYINDDLTNEKANASRILLKEPLEMGASWEDDSGHKSSVTGVDVPVETGAGNFTALEVTVAAPGGNELKFYYTRGVGLVKSVDGDTVVTLNAVNDGAGIEMSVDIFFPGENGGWQIESRSIIVRTNPNFKPLLEAEMRIAPSGAIPLLSEDGRFNRIDNFRSKDLINIDMTEYFISVTDPDQMDVILQGIVNTIGNFFDISEITLTVEQQPYIESIPVEKIARE